MSRLSFSFFLSIALLLICTCSPDEPYNPNTQNESKGTIIFKITWPSKGYVAKIADVEEVSSIAAYVNSESGTEITHVDLRHEGARGKAEISVAAGNNYQIVLVAFESDLIKYIGSDDDVDVVAGGTTTAEVSMYNAAPMLNSGESSGDNVYSFSWSSALFATKYILEEDDSASFTSPATQQTSNLTFSFTNKSAGKYYYRVCSVTPYGNSIWSETKTVEVGSNGTITIDIPWPDESTVNLSVKSPLAHFYDLGYTVTGEVINSGTSDATSVSMKLIARNESGSYLDQITKSIGTVSANSSSGFNVSFSNIPTGNPVETCDYTLTCNEGGSFTGSIVVQ